MNERIQKLCLQAGHEITSTGQYNFEEFLKFQEKFAELIIKECAKAADEGMAQVTMRVEWPSFHIKKHFGVEL